MYEDCVEKFSCNRHPNGCSDECYISSCECVDEYYVEDCCEETCLEHYEETYSECCENNEVFPDIRVVEGPAGRDGEDGSPLEFQWEDTRLKVRVKGTETWYYSPSLRGLEGQQGPQGIPGNTPYIGPNNTWWIDGVDTGVSVSSNYTLPKASKQVLGGVRLTDDFKSSELGEISVENTRDSEKLGGQNPDYYAKNSEVQKSFENISGVLQEHVEDTIAHLSEEEKLALLELNGKLNEDADTLMELANISEALFDSTVIGVGGLIQANTNVFDVTLDMLGKRIMCSGSSGRRLNFPSPVKAGEGAMIEVHANHENGICEIYTPEGKIYKGSYNNAKCAQPYQTIRRYYSTGYNWITNFCRASPYFSIAIRVDPVNGSDDEPKYSGTSRCFASLTNVDNLLREFKSIQITIAKNTTVTLTQSLTFKDCFLGITGDVEQYNSYLVVPSAYNIDLWNVNLGISCLNIKGEGTIFYCAGWMDIVMSGYYGVNIMPNSDVGVTVFGLGVNITPDNRWYNASRIHLSLCRCSFKTSNITNYSKKLNVFGRTDTNYNLPMVFINQKALSGWGSKDANCFWYANADSRSQIGSSGIYVLNG